MKQKNKRRKYRKKKFFFLFKSTVDKYMQSNQYRNLFIFEICQIRTKYVYFLFQFLWHMSKTDISSIPYLINHVSNVILCKTEGSRSY